MYRELRYESGGHRVQRVPETEAKGRIHTSAATVAVLPEPEDVEINLKPDDYRKEIFHASGPGGQHVNKTASAVRLTHYETGIVVSMQDEKSQHKNLAKAIRILKSRLYDFYQQQEHEKRASERKSLVGSGDRSQRIRTYNFPENRVTDHRINLTLYKLDQILAGALTPITEALDRLRSRPVAGFDEVGPELIALRHAAGSDSAQCAEIRMPSDEPWTIGRLLTWTADFLRQHGSDSPQLDAQLLLAHARQCRRIELFTSYHDIASDAVRSQFRELVRQRAEGTPVAYLTGTREFYSLEFHVTRDVLIPRPETEFVVLALLDLVKAHSRPGRVAGHRRRGDRQRDSRHVRRPARAAVPRLGDRHQPARAGRGPQNCQRHAVAERVQLCEGDLLAPVPADVRFDFVLSNPPYVSEAGVCESPAGRARLRTASGAGRRPDRRGGH